MSEPEHSGESDPRPEKYPSQEEFKLFFQQQLRQGARGSVRGVEEVPGLQVGEEVKRWAEDTLFCLKVHAHHVAQGQFWEMVPGPDEGSATQRARAALSEVAAGDSWAAARARRLLEAPPEDARRAARVLLWATINTPEHLRGGFSQDFTREYLGGR